MTEQTSIELWKERDSRKAELLRLKEIRLEAESALHEVEENIKFLQMDINALNWVLSRLPED